MSVARLAAASAPRERIDPVGPGQARPVDWDARERMVRAAQLAGRSGEAEAHIARLAAIDPTFGGVPVRFSGR